MQLVTDDKIYFYIFDKEKYVAELENVMTNFMACSHLHMSKNFSTSCIAFKTNQKVIDIFTRKYEHNFSVCLDDQSFEGSTGIDIKCIDKFLVTKGHKVLIFDNDDYFQCGEIEMPETEIIIGDVIGIQKSMDENWIAIIYGKSISFEEYESRLITLHHINKIDKTFEFHKSLMAKDIPFFHKICMEFHFKNDEDLVIIFAKNDEIFEFNFKTLAYKTIHRFEPNLNKQPNHFVLDHDQVNFVVASEKDGFWIDRNKNTDVDLDQLYEVDCIKKVIYDT